MGSKELLSRTKEFALRIIQILDKLPYSLGNKTIKNQLVRSATGMAANYRATLNPEIAEISLLKSEANQLTAIFTSSVKSLKRKASERTGN